jgi:hypothetical protein
MPKKRKPGTTQLAIAGVIYTLLFAGAGYGLIDRDSDNKCGGVERWSVKVVAADEETEFSISDTFKVTTIDSLNSISTDTFKIKRNTPRQEIETQVYIVKDCFITHAILEDDNDIHLVIEDGNEHSMVAEIPDPACEMAGGSDFALNYKDARQTFLDNKLIYQNYRWTISGILFIDKKHSVSPIGNADNNIELHPVISLERGNKISE